MKLARSAVARGSRRRARHGTAVAVLLASGLIASACASGATSAHSAAALPAAHTEASSLPAGSPPRLAVSGDKILGPAGHPIILRGFNWGQWGTAQPQDAAANITQGANSVRIPLRWWGTWKKGVDSYDPAAPGYIDPKHLALLDQTIGWATSHHLWVILFVDSNNGQGANKHSGNFWTDPS